MQKLSSIHGSLLGHLMADALGSTFEGITPEYLHDQFAGPAEVFERALARSSLRYTDDGQMLLVLAEYLTQNTTIDATSLMHSFTQAYEPWRGYGRGARALIEAFRDEADYEFMAVHLFPGGSLGNGGAMRSSPIGLRFVDNFERIWAEAKTSAWPTHRHELGIEGAQLIAAATSLAQTESSLSAARLSELLLPLCKTVVFQKRLKLLATITNADEIAQFGNGIEAHESVVTALACFALFPDNYRDAISHALWQAGDTDTIGAMTGALVGARIGPNFAQDLPTEKLEDGQPFLDYVEDLANRLFVASSSPLGT